MYKVTLINDGKKTVISSPNFNGVKLQGGQIKQGLNVADGFTFSINPDNPGYSLIQPLKTLITVENMRTREVEFDGRVLMPTESMGEDGMLSKSFICESELGYLNDSSQRHGEYHDITVRGLLEVMIDSHNADISNDSTDKMFTVGIVDVDSTTGILYRYLGYESTMDAIDDKLISRLGGELRVRKVGGVRYLDYVIRTGEDKDTEIKLSKNLKSVKHEVDADDVITRLIPLGQRIESEDEEATDASQARLTIESVNGGKDYIDDPEAMAVFGVIARSQSWDDITLPSRLLTTGQAFLRDNNKVRSNYDITALDLSVIGLDIDSFNVGNTYPVINPIMGIDERLRVIGKTTDIYNPENSTLEFGDKFMTASEYQDKNNKAQLKIVDLENTVERQSSRLSTIQEEINNVDSILDDLNNAIGDANIPALENAVSDLNEAVNNLTDIMDDLPIYDVATETEDGLMSASDKAKSNRISVENPIDLDALDGLVDSVNEKLDLITVVNPIDLDDVVQRLEALENE